MEKGSVSTGQWLSVSSRWEEGAASETLAQGFSYWIDHSTEIQGMHVAWLQMRIIFVPECHVCVPIQAHSRIQH